MRDVIGHADDQGWGRQPAVFGLVPTAVLAQLQPDLVAADDASELSPVQQEVADLDEFLASATWPDAVVGAVVTTVITVVPPAEGEPPVARRGVDDVASHPDAKDGRLAVGVLREGARLALLQMLGAEEQDLLTHPDLAADLVEALAATFEPDDA